MSRKVVSIAAATIVVVLSVVLVGGQIGSGGFLWWGTREPIYIHGNDGFTVENGVFSGSGTAADPFIIEGWRIDHPRADYGIFIDRTTAYFVIRNVVIESAITGIHFNVVQNGRVENTQIALSDTAIHLLGSSFNVFEGNAIARNRYGVVTAVNSRNNIITGNSFLDNGINGHDPHHWNQWSQDGIGNYWSDYRGRDVNQDGIGDVPNRIPHDNHPLMMPPVQWTRVAPAGPMLAGNRVAPDGSLVISSATPISLTAIDPGSGLAEIRYSIDGGPWVVYTVPIHLTGEDGPRRLTYYGIDQLGNAEPKRTISFILDNHPPITRIDISEPKFEDDRGIWITSRSLISLHLVQASTYGATQTFYQIDGRGWRRYRAPFTITGVDGPRRISFYSINASGVTEDVTMMIVIKDDAPPSTRGGQAAAQGANVQVQIGPAIPPVAIEQPVVVEEPAPVVEQLPVEPAAEGAVQTPSDTP